MRKRKKISKAGSKKLFSKTAGLTHVKNVHLNPLRGGIRL